jgi:hypothetical protein
MSALACGALCVTIHLFRSLMSVDCPPVKMSSVAEFTGSCRKVTAPEIEPLVFPPVRTSL